MNYIVYYQGKKVVEFLEQQKINITYISEKQRYLIFYADLKQENNLRRDLKKVKGFKKMARSPLYNEDLNITLNNNE